MNKTPLAAVTNRTIGGVAPSKYLAVIEKKAQLDTSALDKLLATHVVDPQALRSDDFDAHFEHRMAEIIALIESATGKTVQLDLEQKAPLEDLAHFDPIDVEDDHASEGDEAELELKE